ncbi:MAG: regulatory protein TetR [Clostridia bacterium]|nr:regulatory protein TetR [Clostridia bacterium]
MEIVLSKREANKVEKKERIIDTAEKLFLQKDFESTSMDEIAKESHLTKRTVYQYFNSKEDLFYAVALKGTNDYISNCEEALKTGRNALEKLRLLNKTYYQFYINHPGMFRIMNYQPDNKQNCEASPSYQELGAFKNRIVQLYMDIVEGGQSDGSINAKLNPKYAAYFGLLSSVGLLNLVSSMEASYIWGNEGLSESDFLLFSLDLLADALK